MAHGRTNISALANAADSMCISGVSVYIDGEYEKTGIIGNRDYNEKELAVRVAAYNSYNNTNITVDELKKSFDGNQETFHEYDSWYAKNTSTDLDLYEKAINRAMTDKNIDFYELISDEELADIIKTVNEAIEAATEEGKITRENITDVYKEIDKLIAG